MKGLKESLPFQKSVACPSSRTLLSFRSEKLSPTVSNLVSFHLGNCEFCNAELPLLAHYRSAFRGDNKTPEIPRDLKILAESILQSKKQNWFTP
jgi:hypothetical protein